MDKGFLHCFDCKFELGLLFYSVTSARRFDQSIEAYFVCDVHHR